MTGVTGVAAATGVPGVPGASGTSGAVHPWMPVAPCTTGRCVPRSTPAVGPARRLARWSAPAALLLAGIVLSPLVRGRRPVRLWAYAVVRAVGVRLRAGGGRPAAGGLLVVANHISWLDVPALAAVGPGRMLAKAEIAGYPVLGRLAARGGTMFIDRARLRVLPGTVADIGDAPRDGSTVIAFPEGSTWCGRGQGSFRRAVFQAALDTGTPVQPVAVRYLVRRRGAPTAVTAFVGEDTLFASLRRVIGAGGVIAEVTVPPALPPGAYGSRSALARAAERAVATAGNLPDYRPWWGDGEGEVGRWRQSRTPGSRSRRPKTKEPGEPGKRG